ncbi:glycosyltransferase [Thermodesulfobacteriota bacterium]
MIIPAFNEETLLPKTIVGLKASMAACGLPGEVIVVDNNSTDKTSQIAKEYGARVIFEPQNQISRSRNTGAKVARGDYFIFLDADTIPPPGLLKAALNNLESGTCCGGGAQVSSAETPHPLVRNTMNLWNRFSQKFGLAAGCFIYCLRHGFEQVGGFSEKVYASEEIWFSRNLKAWGKSRGLMFQIIPNPPVITSARKFKWSSPLQLALLLLIILCPVALRYRSLCSFWYTRPSKRL